jgi:hypothetical protein
VWARRRVTASFIDAKKETCKKIKNIPPGFIAFCRLLKPGCNNGRYDDEGRG